MKKQFEGQQESRKKIQKVFEEEEQVSQTFKINNFYTNQRLNLPELKQRLEQFKRNHHTLLPPQPTYPQPAPELHPEQISNSFKATFASDTPIEKEKVTLPSANRQRLTHYDEGTKYNEGLNKKAVTSDNDPLGFHKV